MQSLETEAPNIIWQVKILWLAPVLPLLAAGVLALRGPGRTRLAAWLSIGAMGGAFVVSLLAFLGTLGSGVEGEVWRQVYHFDWMAMGEETVRLGWVLDPLTAVMLVMVTLVGLLIFVYSLGYMSEDERFSRFYCFLSLFAAAMLGLVMANSLLLLFICWELVGVASFLLIGFWYHKPSAAAAAQKAFITTRIGDIGFLLGLLWLYSEAGTLLFYDHGNGFLELPVLGPLAATTVLGGMAASTGIGLLIFVGAMGKSGQFPLHVWLPDAMEGPTPVSALIHAATMVAAGVFLVARVFPLMEVDLAGGVSTALQAVTWVGAITAVFAACIAVAQTEIKRILAYSTVSQLGFMMLGLGVGGVAVGMFHLITHAFFKALLFLGAGSVIHGCHGEQDIRRMGGLKDYMPWTFGTYAIGMLALSGVPLLFSGFWSKEEILHSALIWEPSRRPLLLGIVGTFLTAFYMTRQLLHVFYGPNRTGMPVVESTETVEMPPEGLTQATTGPERAETQATPERAELTHREPHESPPVMTRPLAILAFFAVVLGFVGTPAWPWFQGYIEGVEVRFGLGALFQAGTLGLMLLSAVLAGGGIGLGWWLYGRRPMQRAEEPDPLDRMQPGVFAVLRDRFYVDEFYEASVVRFNGWWSSMCDWLDRRLWGGAVELVGLVVLGMSWVNRLIDEYVVNRGFDESCRGISRGGKLLARLQSGRVQHYLQALGIALVVFFILLMWGAK